jgi:hypothetical protein
MISERYFLIASEKKADGRPGRTLSEGFFGGLCAIGDFCEKCMKKGW